jgi:aspartate racemase
MKTIGLIGGISWVSTIDYYRIINSTVNKRLGGNQSARIILHSVNYAEIVAMTHKGDWDGIASMIIAAAQQEEKAGADCILLCANTMHQIAGRVQAAVSVPLIHVAEVTAKAVNQKGIDAVLLLGTRYTMLSDFYRESLLRHGTRLILPDESSMDFVHNTIYNELGQNVFLQTTKNAYLDIINASIATGVRGVILGCTEIPLLLKQEDCPLPVFDTTLLHATAAVDFALSKNTDATD